MLNQTLLANLPIDLQVIGTLCQMCTAMIAAVIGMITFRYTRRQNALSLINHNNALANLVNSTILQSEQAQQGQNPTTRAIAGLKVHTVSDGDSLQSVAFASYGDATRWRMIAEANGIDNPMALRRGTQLSIPTLES